MAGVAFLDDLILILAVTVATVMLGIWWVMRAVQVKPPTPKPELPTMLVKNGILEHANDAALAQFPIALGAHNWNDLHAMLSPVYPEFPCTPLYGQSEHTHVQDLSAGTDQDSAITIEWRKDSATITLLNKSAAMPEGYDAEELTILRELNSILPHPAWKTDTSGAVIWYNEAYSALAQRLGDGAALSKTTPIFSMPSMPEGQNTSRLKLELREQKEPEWFSVTRNPTTKGTLYYATSLTALIKAEEAQHDFVQTLAKTFAQLSIGLAIFNKDRQLALFNPALIDLTDLSVSFLSPRPTIDSFFDAMRENRRMPEPKNYNTWRQRMAYLVNAAETGQFEETWTLETGQTYRVQGRPHPDGAIAFLFEDISAEISLTRNFRAEVELGQSLVDTFEDALAVFSQAGVLTFSNKAYDLLWGFKSDTAFADVTITDAIQLWKEKCEPNPHWQDLHDAVMALGDRETWDMSARISGKPEMQCKIVPIASGATVIRFTRKTVACAAPKALIDNQQT